MPPLTFRVSDVERVTTPLPTTTSIESHLAALGFKTPESFRMAAPSIVNAALVHPLALAVDICFAQHRPLILTPDAVWLCLAQSLATHIDLNAEELRPRLVKHEGQLELEQRRDDFLPGDPDNDWPGAVDGLTAKIREHIGKRADLFIGDFSTTGPVERTASQVALMGAMRNYFRYSVATLCGIPEITLAGTIDDWVSIRRRAAVFREFDLDWWVDVLDPVLAKIEETARLVRDAPEKVDREFWRRLYKMEHESGGDRAYGWLNTFFAYVGDPPERNAFPSVDAGDFEGHKISDYPSGRTRVPFTWRILEERVAMELVGGLFGVTQAAEGGALGVTAGWVVGRAREESGFVRSPGGTSGERTWPATLTPRPGLELESLASLRHEAGNEPTNISLHFRNPKLASIAGIEHVRGLIQFAISEAPLLESAAPLMGMTSLKVLDLNHCPKLTNVGAVLESLPQLETLSLMGNKHLPVEDFFPIAKMQSLTYLVLWHCEALPEAIRKAHHKPEEIAEARRVIASLASTK